ncbi:MAG TPA: hypothetical protein DCM87_17305 [Planctomycetes bacterium]|nr:hypothetical protein [Planctomycetota bacterium]
MSAGSASGASGATPARCSCSVTSISPIQGAPGGASPAYSVRIGPAGAASEGSFRVVFSSISANASMCSRQRGRSSRGLTKRTPPKSPANALCCAARHRAAVAVSVPATMAGRTATVAPCSAGGGAAARTNISIRGAAQPAATASAPSTAMASGHRIGIGSLLT